MRRRLALPVVLALLAIVATSAGGETRSPGATASALAIKIAVPNQSDTTTAVAEAPPASQPAAGGAFQYPGDGSVVSASSTTATASTTVTQNASASSESDVTGLSLFRGLITAAAVTARASAGTGVADAGGNVVGSVIDNLQIDGQPMKASHANLGSWGQLTVGATGVDRSAPTGAQGYRTFVTELDVHLTADYGGLPAGSDIQIGYAEAAAQTAPPLGSTTATTTVIIPTTVDPTAGDAPRLRARPLGKATPQPLFGVHPRLRAGPYLFPVYGPSSYIDTFGASRTDVSGDFHHGDDIFGELGQPLVAVTGGIIFSVGYEKVGGNRLWLLDRQGNQYYYAHLSAFSTAAVNGAHVKAGEVIGFMGNTGDAEGTPTHLHFEVHPVSQLYLGYDGAVDPTAYLKSWTHEQTLPFPIAGGWAPVIPGGKAAPEPGAILLGQRDISTASGLDPSSLRAALQPVPPAQLLQTFVPFVPPSVPKSYPGRG